MKGQLRNRSQLGILNNEVSRFFDREKIRGIRDGRNVRIGMLPAGTLSKSHLIQPLSIHSDLKPTDIPDRNSQALGR
jgi:hypothetical protein